MPHLHRFHVPEAAQGTALALPEEEAHHALRVVRVREGDRVALFDGQGREFLARVSHCGRREVEVAVEEMRESPRPEPALSLAMAWLHQDKPIEFIIRHGTEVGVDRFCFFRAERSERTPKACEKWRRLAIEACKQSGRLWLPEFVVAGSLQEVLHASGGILLIGALEEPPVPLAVPPQASAITLLIGPEGDFTREETAQALARGALPFSLGPTVFKAEMAAVLAATLIQYHAGRLGPRA